MPEISGVSHIGLTVADLDRSKDWYYDLFGLQELFGGDEEGIRYVVTAHASGLVIGLREHKSGAKDTFTPERTGLDHLAFQCADRAELEKWQATFEEKGITYTPIIDTDYGHVLNFKDPDNIALEMFALKSG